MCQTSSCYPPRGLRWAKTFSQSLTQFEAVHSQRLTSLVVQLRALGPHFIADPKKKHVFENFDFVFPLYVVSQKKVSILPFVSVPFDPGVWATIKTQPKAANASRSGE